MTVYGYARISTKQQSIERQIRNILKESPEAKIYQEAYTGTTLNRPEFDKLKNRVKEGDTIIFDSVSRMSRNADDGLKLYEEMLKKGVSLVFIKEPYINTKTYQEGLEVQLPPTDNEILQPILNGIVKALEAVRKQQIRQAFEQAQKEVDDLKDRTREGIETARLNGKQIGQAKGKRLNVKKAIEAKEKIKKHSKTFGGNLTDAEIMELCNITHNTLYKYKREIKQELGQ